MKYSIYVADDEQNIRELIGQFLEKDGYAVKLFADGDALLRHFEKEPCDLVVLDIMMPGTDGIEVCRRLRETTAVPIIMLTAKDSEADYIRGITTGSDDYLTKPFKPTLLLMRVRALLRRVELDKKAAKEKRASRDARFGDLFYKSDENILYCGGKPLAMTQTELRLLVYMVQNAGKSFSREELLEEIWGLGSYAETRVTDETLRRIRKKLKEAESRVHVETIWGFGYRLVSDGEES
ncbi:MAG: response regulator transcription factor [Lachnospiraceae bacterium]|nr:response regulator transcription factor [Lachnospiraceae bacterium]